MAIPGHEWFCNRVNGFRCGSSAYVNRTRLELDGSPLAEREWVTLKSRTAASGSQPTYYRIKEFLQGGVWFSSIQIFW